ncbi:MAG TPA: nucleotidyltransferase family protein, partial [Thermoanaerobaculia bacterium]|nr:nucleotidyltransferase family protein [Thermoanaerobaculia bacterium]
IHFRLLNLGPPAAAEPAWADAAAWHLGGLEVPVPAPERFLLHLALHARQHGHCLLRLFADLAVHRATWAVDPARFAALAREHHLAGAAWLSLQLAAELFDRPDIAAPATALAPSPLGRFALAALWRPRRALALAAPRWPVRAELPRAYLLSGAPLREKLAWTGAVASGGLARRRARKRKGTRRP